MRIPTLEAPSVEEASAPGAQPVLQSPDNNIEQGIGAAVQGVGQLGTGISNALARAEAARQKAEATAAAAALAQLDNAATATFVGDSASGKQGYLSTKGTAASEASSRAMEDFSKARAKIADGLGGGARKLFDTKSRDVVNEWHRRVEGHVSTQRQHAADVSAEALRQSTLDAIANMPPGAPFAEESIAKRTATLLEAIDATAVSPEDKAAKRAKVMADVAGARVATAIANDDPELAKAQLEKYRSDLGDSYGKAQALVAHALKAQTENAASAANEATVAAMADAARDEYGIVDKAKFLAGLSTVPAERREKMRAAYNATDNAETEKKKAVLDEWKNQAYAFIRQGKPIEAGLADRIGRYDNKFLVDLDNDAAAKQRQRERENSHDARERKAAQRAQDAIDSKAIEEFQKGSHKLRADARLDDFLLAYPGASERARRILSNLQTASKDFEAKDFGKEMDAITDAGEKEFKKSAAPAKKGKAPKLDEEQHGFFRAELSKEVESFVTREKRVPTNDERNKMISTLLANHVNDDGPTGEKEFEARALERGLGGLAKVVTKPAPKVDRPIVKKKGTGERFYLNADGSMEPVK